MSQVYSTTSKDETRALGSDQEHRTGCLNGRTVVRVAKGTTITAIIGGVALAALKFAPVWVPLLMASGPIGWTIAAVGGVGLLCALTMIALISTPREQFIDRAISFCDCFEKAKEIGRNQSNFNRHEKIISTSLYQVILSTIRGYDTKQEEKNRILKQWNDYDSETKNEIIYELRSQGRSDVIDFLNSKYGEKTYLKVYSDSDTESEVEFPQ